MALDLDGLQRLVEHVQAGRDADERDESWIRLSGAGHCGRQLGYKVLGAKAEAEPLSDLVTFEVGHAIHARVQGWLQGMGWLRPELTEFPLEDRELRLRGKTDGITERLDKEGRPSPTGGRRVVEIKSIGNTPGEVFGRDMAIGSFERLSKPKDWHIDQANCYAWLWNRGLEAIDRRPLCSPIGPAEAHTYLGMVWPEDRIDTLTFIYVAKDGKEHDLPLKVFTQAVSEKRLARLGAKFAAIWTAIDAGELPPRDENPFSRYSPCCWCPFRAMCIEGEADGEEGNGYAEGEEDQTWADRAARTWDDL
jgi:hypothetical protein